MALFVGAGIKSLQTEITMIDLHTKVIMVASIEGITITGVRSRDAILIMMAMIQITPPITGRIVITGTNVMVAVTTDRLVTSFCDIFQYTV